MSYLGESRNDYRAGVPPDSCAPCHSDAANGANTLTAAFIVQKSLTMVKDISFMQSGIKHEEVEALVNSISLELISLVNKRKYFQTLKTKYNEIVKEYRANQADA